MLLSLSLSLPLSLSLSLFGQPLLTALHTNTTLLRSQGSTLYIITSALFYDEYAIDIYFANFL